VKKIYLIRHGHTDNEGIFDCYSSISINQQGKKASVTLGKWLNQSSIDIIYSSPITRALETAEVINKYLQVPHRVEKGFREIDFGDWQGKSYREIFNQSPNYLDEVGKKRGLFTFPNGENIAQFNHRVWHALEKVTNKTARNVVIVTHKGVIESIISRILSISSVFPPLTITPASCSILLLGGSRWTVESLNICFNYERKNISS